jgi:hypothetical protein
MESTKSKIKRLTSARKALFKFMSSIKPEDKTRWCRTEQEFNSHHNVLAACCDFELFRLKMLDNRGEELWLT